MYSSLGRSHCLVDGLVSERCTPSDEVSTEYTIEIVHRSFVKVGRRGPFCTPVSTPVTSQILIRENALEDHQSSQSPETTWSQFCQAISIVV